MPSAVKRAAFWNRAPWVLPATIAFVLLLAFCFANVEIQIEGAAGWAADLPTWRVRPDNWLLSLAWGGREVTGYHVWIFSCVALFFHFPTIFAGRWNLSAEARVLGCISLFWIAEDFLWFIMNPAYGLARFDPAQVPWHPHWWLGAPIDYWIGLLIAAALFVFSARER
jgi:hypothetical protein